MKKTSLVLVFLFIVVYAFAQAPDWQWAAQAGGISDDSGHSITIDDSGNSYVIGKFENTATFGSYSLTSYGGMDIFIAKSDANGNWQWATKAGGTAHEQGNGITIDNAGNTYVTGCFRGTSTFGSYSLTCIGGMDIFIAKIDVNGNWQWVSQAGGTNLDYDSGYGITIDNAGNSYITGNFQGTTTFGSFSLTSIGLSDIFVAKIDASGNWQWASQAGGSINDSGYGITMDSAGYCYVTGYFNNTASFGSNAISSIGGTDIFVAKIDANGNWQWATNAGSTYNDYGYGITIDSAGNNYVTGDFRLTASFDSYNLTSIGWTDIFVAKIDDSGNWQWASQAGGFDYDYGYGITIDNSGNSYVTGEFESSATFGSYAIISNGYSDIFLAKMDASGNWLWAAKAGSTYWDESKAIAVDNSGFCYVTGNFQDTVNFSSYSLTSIGGSDIFVAKLIPLTADFTADITSGIDQLTVNFTDLSTFNSTSWEWDFNYDGTIDSYSQNPTWTYNEPGAYTVSLSASDGSISDTETKSDYINVRVNIPDANFKAVINSYLGQPPDYNPSVADLNSITGTFDASNSNISSIDGSQYLTNLTNLNFSNNQIIDISFVSVLTNLLELELSSNQIIDILAISSLTNLTYLWLGSNQIIDISVVSGLTNLTELYLYYNQISDISLISNLTNLTNLNFSNNQIIDISAVSGLTALIELWLSHNQIIDISAISCLTNLYFLHLSSNQISDIYPLVENTGLSSGDYLYSDTNPFSHEALSVHIPILLSRGIYLLCPSAPNNYAACYPDPSRNEIGVSQIADLEWRGNFPTDDAVYDVWLGETNDNLVNVGNGTGINDTLYSFTPILNPDTDYWWKIRAITATDTIWSGLWNFNTDILPLVADFTVSDILTISGSEIQFTDLSTGNPTSWEWDFENDGTIDSTIQNPSWTYANPGLYTISLTIYDGTTSDTETKIDYIDVRVNIPDANFKSEINSVLGQPASYNPTVADLNGITGTFEAYNSNISSIEGAQYLTNLSVLYLSNNQISDISPVSGLTNLDELRLSWNQISDIPALSGLINLNELHLTNNQIIEISGVSSLTNLTQLWLQINQISDIFAVSGLTNLTNLYFHNNQIIDISAISSLTNLDTLYLSNNQISDISAISGLTNLTVLGLWINQISDIYALVENTGLGSGDHLNLNSNPLSQEALNVHIPILQSRGFSSLVYLSTPNNYAACYPNPARNETEVSINADLEWRGNFPTDDAVYDVWLGETNDNLVNVGNGTAINDTLYFLTPSLNPYTNYWWKVRAVTSTDTIWSGLWHFTTIDDGVVTADFTADHTNIVVGTEIQFTDLSTANITSWEWDFENDGTIDSYEQNPAFTYSDIGIYTVSLTVTNGTNSDTEIKVDFISVFDDEYYSLSFDGVDNYVDFSNIDIISTGVQNEYSVSFWLNMHNYNTAVTGDQAMIFGDEISQNNGILIQIHSTYGYGAYIAGSTNWAGYSNYLPPLNQWVFFTQIQNTNGIDLYINGSFYQHLTSQTNSETSANTRVGLHTGSTGAASRPFDGKMDQLSVWNKVLTQQEIQYNMYNELTGNEPGLVGSWNFNEGLGDIAYDSTVNGNNGTIYGAIWSTDVPFPLLPSELTWSLQIESTIGSCFDNDNYLGVAEGATYGYDIGLDQVEPPFPPGDYIATYFPHPEWSYPLGDNFTLDAFPEIVLDDTMQVWHFDVETNQVGDVTLTFNFTDIPAFPVILEDEQTGIHWEINNGETYTFESSSTRSINHFNIAIGDITPPTAEWTYPNGLDIFQSDSLITLTWNAADNYQLDSVYVAYSNDGGTVYNDIVTLTTEQNYDWTFPSWYYEDDIYFRIISEDHAGNTATDFSDYATIVSGDSLEISVNAGWSLWGAPFVPYDSDMFNNLSDDLIDWVTYDYVDGGYTFDGILILGEGYWLGTSTTGNVDILGEIATNPQEVTIVTGWNILSNPLVVNVPKTNLSFNDGTETKTWADAVTAGWIIDQLYGWDGSSYTDETTFEYWKAYWIGATVDLTLISENLPPTETIRDLREIFRVNLTAETPDGEIDRIVVLGHSPEATDLYDIGLDIPKAPNAPNSILRLVFHHPEWNHILGDDFAKDIRPEITGYDINFWYLTGTTDELVTLSWVFENLPDDLNVNLYISEEVINMTEISNIDISVADFSSFEIRTGFESTNSEDDLIPIKTNLYGNYPNPFNPETTISFGLKSNSQVLLQIYNIKGQLVETLINENKHAGYHNIKWNAKDISSGIYFYKLNINGKTKSVKKCLLLK